MADIWAAPLSGATNAGNNVDEPLAVGARRQDMAEDREKISTGPNDRAVNENIAGTAPGIPDDALAPGEKLPEPPSDEEVERVAQKLGANVGERDTLPLEGE
jgi:hypothetical protein